ncbi:DUF2249 domain-containing protein [Pontibacter locisalis]|uniref:DUF2249 domain-containing protein n=1 Tax=Pontibacter locisalis TaxID=1719035 RepID=A0ABW5IGW9_9BACT
MEIAANTKISAILKANPDAIEAIASINRHFDKLRNPLLRKVLASRVTIADAARIGGCSIEEFYKCLEPLGFKHNSAPEPLAKPGVVADKPSYLRQLTQENFQVLDVREDISSGNDPFLKIMDSLDKVKGNKALQLVNTFEPTPLIDILKKKGYESYTEVLNEDLVHTYFWLIMSSGAEAHVCEPETPDFDVIVNNYEGRIRNLDVRHLEMPQPMVTILNELEILPATEALFVTHRKVPHFLLPKLKERGYEVAVKEAAPPDVHLLIYRKL